MKFYCYYLINFLFFSFFFGLMSVFQAKAYEISRRPTMFPVQVGASIFPIYFLFSVCDPFCSISALTLFVSGPWKLSHTCEIQTCVSLFTYHYASPGTLNLLQLAKSTSSISLIIVCAFYTHPCPHSNFTGNLMGSGRTLNQKKWEKQGGSLYSTEITYKCGKQKLFSSFLSQGAFPTLRSFLHSLGLLLSSVLGEHCLWIYLYCRDSGH